MSNASVPLFLNGRWLVCRPEDYDVRYKINPWMDPGRVPEKQLALNQWKNLHHHLLRLGAWLEYVPHASGLPDMVFTANAGLVDGRDVVLSTFRHKERQGEAAHFRAWFEANGYRVNTVNGAAFEGEGDALFMGRKLVCGYGFRSDLSAHSQVGALLNVSEVVSVELTDPRFYHLDTCFSPITESTALIYPGAFTSEGLLELEKHADLIRVTEAEALHFVCNAVVLGTSIVLPAQCPDTYALLAKRGFTVYPVELSEFIKAGGAAKCLTLKLDR
jgi:N-dimethylarginine dimethylaminohydrolase